MFSKLGIGAVLIGFFVWVFSMISRFMAAETIWTDITLSTLNQDLAESCVNAVSAGLLQNGLNSLFYEIPLGGVIMGLGGICFLISLFVKEH